MKQFLNKKVAIIILSVFLAISFIATIYLYNLYYTTKTELDNHNEHLNPEEGISAVDEEDLITVEQFKEVSQELNISIEYLQRFFPNEIVVKQGGEILYLPIDKSLALSNYNYLNMETVDGFKVYDDGAQKSIAGIDVSYYQGVIDWEAVANDPANIEFAIIRAGYRGYVSGDINIDEQFLNNLEGSTSAGIDTGVYFFSQAINEDEAREEANFIIENIKDYNVTYPIVFDMEEVYDDNARTNNLTATEITDITIAFCEEIKAAGYTPVVYGNIGWMMFNLELSRLEDYDKWFAQYFRQPFFPYEYSMWQYTANGEVDGIEGPVDLNISFIDYSDPAATDSSATTSTTETSSLMIEFINSGEMFELTENEAKAIEAILTGEWNFGTSDCLSDIKMVTTDGKEISYHSECGTFNGTETSLTTDEDTMNNINDILAKYGELGFEI